MTERPLLTPPTPPHDPVHLQGPGDARVDEFYWMRERDNPKVLDHLRAENEHTEAYMQRHEVDVRGLYDELLGRIQETDRSVETRMGDHVYYSRTEAGLAYAIECRRAALDEDAPEQVLLDPNAWAEEYPFVGIGDFEVSACGRWLAYTLDRTGFRQYDLFIKDLEREETVQVDVPRVTSVIWAADDVTLLLTQEDEQTKRAHRLLALRRGEQRPHLLREEPDERFNLGVTRTRDRRFLLLYAESHTTSEVRATPSDRPLGDWSAVLPRRDNIEYDVEHRRGAWIIRINDVGPGFRLVERSVNASADAPLRELIAHRENVPLTGFEVFAHHIILEERRDGLGHLTVLTDTGERRAIDVPDAAYELSSGWNPEFDAPGFRFCYESPARPPTDYEYRFADGHRDELRRRPVLGDFDPSRYRVRRCWVEARDEVKVPMTLVERVEESSDEAAETPRPTLLTGYGAYGYAYPTLFSSAQLSLLDRGVRIVIAHIRGGGELGKAWHEAGRMEHKNNTFSDFIDCAQWLVETGETSPSQLAIEGGSAGGLLVGAVINARPELFGAALSQVPFVDVLTTMSDPSLPLTIGEYEEWGDPSNATDYARMRAYCPYTNLREAAFPTMLVRTSLHDSQVMYWEPAKYVARMRERQQADAPILLHVNMDGGHGGSSGRYDRLREIAFDYAFVLGALGVPAFSAR